MIPHDLQYCQGIYAKKGLCSFAEASRIHSFWCEHPGTELCYLLEFADAIIMWTMTTRGTVSASLKQENLDMHKIGMNGSPEPCCLTRAKSLTEQ